MVLHEASYELALDIDGTLRWSRVVSLREIGVLWEPGLAKPLLHGHVAAARGGNVGGARAAFQRLRTGDPLDARLMGVSTTTSRRRGCSGGARADCPEGPKRPRRDVVCDGQAVAERVADLPSHDTPGDVASGATREAVGVLEQPHDNVPRGGGVHEMDMQDEEMVDLFSDDSAGEFAAAYDLDGLGARPSDALADGVAPRDEACPDVGFAGEVARSLVEGGARDLGMADEDVGVGQGEEAGSEPSEAARGADVVAELPALPTIDDVGDPSSLGYCYMGGRSVLRIQVGKPKHSTTVNCYHHPSCKLLLSLSRCPDITTLKAWFLEVPKPPAGATGPEKKALARRHMQLGNSRWKGRRAAEPNPDGTIEPQP